jgi:hypothetical protein
MQCGVEVDVGEEIVLIGLGMGDVRAGEHEVP